MKFQLMISDPTWNIDLVMDLGPTSKEAHKFLLSILWGWNRITSETLKVGHPVRHHRLNTSGMQGFMWALIMSFGAEAF